MIFGTSTIVPIELAASISEQSRSVGRLTVMKGEEKSSSGIGTAFLIDKDIILTAAHVVGKEEEWPTWRYSIDFEFLAKKSASGEVSLFLDAAPYPWADPAAGELHGLLANAYENTQARLTVLALAGVPSLRLLHDGTPHETWHQALDVAAKMGRTRAVVETVLKDDTVPGFHDKIRKLISPAVPVDARPVAVDWNMGWGALRLDKPLSRSPLALDNVDRLKAGDPVIIIQHPMGEYKQFVIETTGIVGVTDQLVRYRADTTAGSSGAPVFDKSMKVVAVHFRGGQDANEGVRIDLVKAGLRQHGLSFIEAVPDLKESPQVVAQSAPSGTG